MSSKEFNFMMSLVLTLIEEKKFDKLEELVREAIDKSKE